MVRAAFLFPGQGAQYPGMAMDFLEAGEEFARLFELASDLTGMKMTEVLCDPVRLARTDCAQAAITLANLASAALLRKRGTEPSLAAGHSLGEYAALTAAGVITVEDCFRVVAVRGALMQAASERAAPRGGGGMAAVLGLVPETVEALTGKMREEGWEIWAANFNAPRQTVVSGTTEALDAAGRRFLEAGARRFVPLKTAGAFHSPLMGEAEAEFRKFLGKIRFSAPEIPVFSNVTGRAPGSGDEARDSLRLSAPVLWLSVEAAIAAMKPDAVLETGPGGVLRGLWRAGGLSPECLAAGTVEEIGRLYERKTICR
jgi:[acyl-carrier-protein] S-malonyltransferase